MTNRKLLPVFFAGLFLIGSFATIPNEAFKTEASSESEVSLELNSTYWGSTEAYYSIYYWGGDNPSTWPGTKLGKGSGNDILTGTWDPTSTKVKIARFSSSDYSTQWNYWEYFGEDNPFTAGSYNYFVNTEWDSCSSYYCYKVTKHIEDNTVTEWAKNSEVYNPTDATVTAKAFDGWYLDSSFNTPYTPVTPTEDIELWAKFVAAENKTYYLYDPRGFFEDVVYCYSFVKSNGSNQTAWPGNQMVKQSDHLYKIEVPNTYDSLIFDDNGAKQTFDITDALSNTDGYYVITHSNVDGSKLYGDWWTSTTSPYSVTINGNNYPLSLNLTPSVGGVVANNKFELYTETPIANVNLGDGYLYYKGSTEIPVSSISINSGANAYKVDYDDDTTNMYVHNTASNVNTYLMKITDGGWSMYTEGYDSVFTYCCDNIMDICTPESGYVKAASIVADFIKNEVLTFEEEGVTIDNSKITIKTGTNLYLDGSEIKVKNDVLDATLLIQKDSSGNYLVSLSGAESTLILEVNGSDTYNLVLNSGSEYMSETDIALKAGDILSFYIDGTIQDINPKSIGNNNCYFNDGGSLAVLTDVTAKVYVDFSAGTCFCGGLDFGVYGLIKNNEYVKLTQNANPSDPSYSEWSSASLNFTNGDALRFIDTTSSTDLPTVFDVTSINEYSVSGFEVVNGKIKYTAEEAKDIAVYLKLKSGADEIYFGEVTEEVATAISFAKSFNNAISAICQMDGSTQHNDLSNKWHEFATTFNSLITSSQNVLKNATESYANEEIVTFIDKYNFIYQKYGTTLALENFLDKVYASNSLRINNINNNSMLIVMVIASITTIAAVSGLLILKKKRQH